MMRPFALLLFVEQRHRLYLSIQEHQFTSFHLTSHSLPGGQPTSNTSPPCHMASLRRNKALSPDGETAKFLYTIIKQLDLKIIDWNVVADGLGITNGHAARMRYSRFKQHIEGIPTQSRAAKKKNDGKKETEAAKGQKRKSPDGEEGSKGESKTEQKHEPVKEEVFRAETTASKAMVTEVKPEPSIKPEPTQESPPQACHVSPTVDVKVEQMPANTIQPPHHASATKLKQESGAKKRSPSGQAKAKSPVTTVKPEPEPLATTPATTKHERVPVPTAPMKPFIYPPPSGWYPIPTPQYFPPPWPLFNASTEAIAFDANPYPALHSPPPLHASPETRPLQPPPDMTAAALSELHLSPNSMLRPAPSIPYQGGWMAQPQAAWPEHSAPVPAMDRGLRPSSAQPQAVVPMESEARSGMTAEPDMVPSEERTQAMDEAVACPVEEDQPMPDVVSVTSEAVAM